VPQHAIYGLEDVANSDGGDAIVNVRVHVDKPNQKGIGSE